MGSQKGELLFLGTGGSMGIPIVGCSCAVCRSEFPKNKRLRPSALITCGEKKVLIDAGPDFRTQALNYQVNRLDGVIFTHAHHDHTAGLDDLRVYNIWSKKKMPCLVSKDTGLDLKDRFKYIFAQESAYKLVSKIDLVELESDRGNCEFCGMKFGYFTYSQAKMKVNGFRFGNLGFVSDIREFSETIFEDLKGIEKLVLSALRFEFSPLHFSIEEAIQFSKKIGATETWLTHIAHEVDHETASRLLPPNVYLAYDGLAINFEM